jgi:hypothetical protein
MLRRRVADLAGVLRGRRHTLRWGQLDNRDFEALLTGIVAREKWEGGRRCR